METIGDPGGAGVALFVACTLRRQGFALVAQRIEQKTFRLQTPPPHRTTYEGSGAEVVGRAMGVRLFLADAQWWPPWIDRQSH